MIDSPFFCGWSHLISIDLLLQFGQVPSNFMIDFNLSLSISKVVDRRKLLLRNNSSLSLSTLAEPHSNISMKIVFGGNFLCRSWPQRGSSN